MSIPNQMGSSLKTLVHFALKKGELGARVARLRLEIASLTRSKEAAFARLGRGYHADPSATADLEPLLREVDRIASEIRDRQSVLAQLLQPKAPQPLPAAPFEVSGLAALEPECNPRAEEKD